MVASTSKPICYLLFANVCINKNHHTDRHCCSLEIISYCWWHWSGARVPFALHNVYIQGVINEWNCRIKEYFSLPMIKKWHLCRNSQPHSFFPTLLHPVIIIYHSNIIFAQLNYAIFYDSMSCTCVARGQHLTCLSSTYLNLDKSLGLLLLLMLTHQLQKSREIDVRKSWTFI